MWLVQVQYDRYRFSMTGTKNNLLLSFFGILYCAAFLTNFCFIKHKNVHHYTHQRVAIFVLKIKRNVMILKCAAKSSFLQLRLHLKKLYRHKWEIIFFKLASLCIFLHGKVNFYVICVIYYICFVTHHKSIFIKTFIFRA